MRRIRVIVLLLLLREDAPIIGKVQCKGGMTPSLPGESTCYLM